MFVINLHAGRQVNQRNLKQKVLQPLYYALPSDGAAHVLWLDKHVITPSDVNLPSLLFLVISSVDVVSQLYVPGASLLVPWTPFSVVRALLSSFSISFLPPVFILFISLFQGSEMELYKFPKISAGEKCGLVRNLTPGSISQKKFEAMKILNDASQKELVLRML